MNPESKLCEAYDTINNLCLEKADLEALVAEKNRVLFISKQLIEQGFYNRASILDLINSALSLTVLGIQSKITELEALVVEKDKALKDCDLFFEHLRHKGNWLAYMLEYWKLVKKALSLTPADIRSQLEEARKEIERLKNI